MENVKLVTVAQNHEWEVYAWKDGGWPELVGLFETEAEADAHAQPFKVTVLKGVSTAEAYAELERLY